MANIKTRTQYIKESYNRPSISDSRRNKSNYDRLKSQATNAGVKHVAKNLNMFPQEQMDMFIHFIKDQCVGSVITLVDIEGIVKKYLRVSTENDIYTARANNNLDITKAISELIYDEMKERNLLDCTDKDEFDEDLDFNNDVDVDVVDDIDEVDGFQDNDEIRESIKRRKPIIKNRRK